MSDMIGVPISFARRRRMDLVQLALTLRQNARLRAGPRHASIANAFESDDAKQTAALAIMC